MRWQMMNNTTANFLEICIVESVCAGSNRNPAAFFMPFYWFFNEFLKN